MLTVSNEAKSLFAIFWISVFQLGFELFFVKLSYYQIGALSLGFLGLAMAGVCLAAPLASLFRSRATVSTGSAWGAPLSAAIAGAALFSLSHLKNDKVSLLFLVIAALGAVAFMALSSLPLVFALERNSEKSHRLYAAALAGNAIGPVIALGLGTRGDIPAYSILVGLCAMFGAIVYERSIARLGSLLVAVSLTIICLISFVTIERMAHPGALLTESDAFSRIEAMPIQNGQIRFLLSGVTGKTDTPPLNANDQGDKRLGRSGLPSVPALLAPRRVLVLASGAGRQVQEALDAGAETITAVDLNTLVPNAMERLVSETQNPYRSPKVRFLAKEIRQTARQERLQGNTYDLIYIVFANTSYDGTSGQAFQPNYIQTREAFEEYLGLLAPGGALAVVHFTSSARGDVSDNDPRRQKALRALNEALQTHKRLDSTGHLVAFKNGEAFLALARPDLAFSLEEVRHIRDSTRGLSVLPLETELVRAQYLRPITDDTPFLENERLKTQVQTGFHDWPRKTLSFLLTVLAAVVLLGLGVSVWTASRAAGGRENTRHYSALLVTSTLLGVGYVFYQSIMIQRLSFVLGHPVLSTAIGLCGALLATAAGSHWSETKNGFHRSFRGRAAAALLLASFWALGLAEPRTLIAATLPVSVRISIALFLSVPPFFVMGTFFPTVLKRAGQIQKRLLSWCWAMNGLASIYGSILVVVATMTVGFQRSFAIPFLLYSAVIVLLQLRPEHRLTKGVGALALAVIVVVPALLVWVL